MKEIKLTENQVKRIVEEFSKASFIGDNKIDLGEFETISCEEEEIGFDSFIDENGHAFSGLPGLALPFKVTGSTLEVFPCTEDYGLTCERGLMNLQRSLRFFLMEIYENKLHVKHSNIPEHPLKNK